MKTTDVPHLKGATMSDSKSTSHASASKTASETKADTPKAGDPPVRLGESSDPRVHQLLAERQTHVMNLQALETPTDSDAVKTAKDAIADLDKQIADLDKPADKTTT